MGLHAQGPVLLKGRVSIVENLGKLVMADVDIGGAELLIVKLPGSSAVKAGDDIALVADPARLHLYDLTGLAFRGNP